LAVKTPNFAELQPTRRQLRVTEMVQHINKQITDVSSTTTVLKQHTKLGGITQWGFSAT